MGSLHIIIAFLAVVVFLSIAAIVKLVFIIEELRIKLAKLNIDLLHK